MHLPWPQEKMFIAISIHCSEKESYFGTEILYSPPKLHLVPAVINGKTKTTEGGLKPPSGVARCAFLSLAFSEVRALLQKFLSALLASHMEKNCLDKGQLVSSLGLPGLPRVAE